MGLLKGVETPYDFPNGTALSAAALNVLLRNNVALDTASRYGRVAFCSGYGENPENADTNPALLWRGGFRFVTGATTLTIVTNTSGQQSGDTLRVTRDGATNNDFTIANGIQTHTVTISGAGYAEGQVVEVRISAVHATPGDRNWGTFEVRDGYIGPIGLADAWPGVPLFGAISEANLDLMSNAVAWLIRRIGQRVEPLMQAVIRRNGPFTGQTTVRWTGSITKTAGHPTIKALLVILQGTAGTVETVRMRVNGTQVATHSVATTPGEAGVTLSYDASAVATGTLLWIELDMVKTSPTEDEPGPLGKPGTSRLSIYRVWSEAAAGAETFEPELSMGSSYTFGPSGTEGTLLTWLNRLRNDVEAVKGRIDANGEIWNRQPLYRARYAFDDDQFAWFEPGAVALTMSRIGDALLLRGKGITIAYGPGTFKDEKDQNEVGLYEFENFKSETAIDADAVETQRVYLDSIPGLPPFAPYNVRGVDLYYAGEELFVEET